MFVLLEVAFTSGSCDHIWKVTWSKHKNPKDLHNLSLSLIKPKPAVRLHSDAKFYYGMMKFILLKKLLRHKLFVIWKIHTTDFDPPSTLTIGVGFIRIACKLSWFLRILFSGHVTFQIWSRLQNVTATFTRTNMAKNQTKWSKAAQDMMDRRYW